jgi:hypothetical protein
MKASTKKVKHPKLDPYLISLKQKYELTYIVARFKKLGITVTADDVRAAVRAVGKSRRKVYNRLKMMD